MGLQVNRPFVLDFRTPALVEQARQGPPLVATPSPGASPFGGTAAEFREAFERAVAQGAPLATIRALRTQWALADERERTTAFFADVPGAVPPVARPLTLNPDGNVFTQPPLTGPDVSITDFPGPTPGTPPPGGVTPGTPPPGGTPIGVPAQPFPPAPVASPAPPAPTDRMLRELGLVLLLTSPAWLTLLLLGLPTKRRAQ